MIVITIQCAIVTCALLWLLLLWDARKWQKKRAMLSTAQQLLYMGIVTHGCKQYLDKVSPSDINTNMCSVSHKDRLSVHLFAFIMLRALLSDTNLTSTCFAVQISMCVYHWLFRHFTCVRRAAIDLSLLCSCVVCLCCAVCACVHN